jgi:hypothetical protein
MMAGNLIVTVKYHHEAQLPGFDVIKNGFHFLLVLLPLPYFLPAFCPSTLVLLLQPSEEALNNVAEQARVIPTL